MEAKVQAGADCPTLANQKQLKSFLGLALLQAVCTGFFLFGCTSLSVAAKGQ